MLPQIQALKAQGVRAGDAFDMAVGGLADKSAGEPLRIAGTVLQVIDTGTGSFGSALGLAAATC